MDNKVDLAIYQYLKNGYSFQMIRSELKKQGTKIYNSRISRVSDKIKRIESGQPLTPKVRNNRRGSYKYSSGQLNKLKREAEKENPLSSRRLAIATGIKRSSVQYHLKRTFNLKLVKKPRVHHLTPKQIATRRSRALPLYNFLKDNLMKVLTTDEKIFTLNASGGQSVYQYLNKHQKRKHAKAYYKRKLHAKSVMVWAGICATGRTKLYFVKPGVKVNAKYYINRILKPVFKDDFKRLFPNGDGILQQDSAPAHKAKITLKFINDCKMNYITPAQWTSNSPDNSPMDYYFWSELDRRVNMRKPKSLAGLKRVLKDEYMKIPQNQILNAMLAWPKRCLLIHKANGEQIERFL